jgi:hypothetical protein
MRIERYFKLFKADGDWDRGIIGMVGMVDDEMRTGMMGWVG